MRLTGNPVLAVLALAGCAATGAAPAPTDFEAMSAAQRESYCIAWVSIANYIAVESGRMSQQDYNESEIDLAWKVQNKGDNRNYSGDYRRIKAADAIIASEPDEAEAEAAIGYCRGYLRL